MHSYPLNLPTTNAAIKPLLPTPNLTTGTKNWNNVTLNGTPTKAHKAHELFITQKEVGSGHICAG